MRATINDPLGWRLARRLRALPGGWPGGVLLALLAAVLVVQIVRLFYAIVTPAGPAGDWQPAAPQAMPAAARAELFARVDPFYRALPDGGAGTSNVTALQLQLFGVRINEASAGGAAIIAGSDGVQNSVGVGEEIQPGVTLVAVHFDHVEIDNQGRRELLYLDQSQGDGGATGGTPASAPTPPPASATGTPAAAPAAAPQAALTPAALRSGIGVQPRLESGRVTGIRVAQQGDGAAFQAAGFRAGDVIRSINGRAISSATDAAGLTAQLRPGARLSLEVERGAGTVPIAITIPGAS
jgi:general secretion pathway protein C